MPLSFQRTEQSSYEPYQWKRVSLCWLLLLKLKQIYYFHHGRVCSTSNRVIFMYSCHLAQNKKSTNKKQHIILICIVLLKKRAAQEIYSVSYILETYEVNWFRENSFFHVSILSLHFLTNVCMPPFLILSLKTSRRGSLYRAMGAVYCRQQGQRREITGSQINLIWGSYRRFKGAGHSDRLNW